MSFLPIRWVANTNDQIILFFGDKTSYMNDAKAYDERLDPTKPTYNADLLDPTKSDYIRSAPIPSVCRYILSDVSEADSGRTEDGMMWKMKKGQMRKLELAWNYPDSDVVSLLLNGFDNEYFKVNYFDVKINGYRNSTFYVGDRMAPLYNALLGIWENVAFNIIERGIT